MPEHHYKEFVNARFEVVWQNLLNKIEHPEKYVKEIRNVEILERQPDHILRLIQFENTSWQELKELITADKETGTVVYRLVDHPHFEGDTINRCRITHQTCPSELEYALCWKLKDANAMESAEAKDNARQALEAAVKEMKRTSEEVESTYASLHSSTIDISPNATWMQTGVIVAGGNGKGDGVNQFNSPRGFYIDDEQTMYIVDCRNHRIMKCKPGETSCSVIAGGNGNGGGANQLSYPNDVIVDKERDSLIISDYGNKRVVRWSRQNGTDGEIIISNIGCTGLAMDDDQFLYVADYDKHEVRRYRVGETQGTVVAGGNGQGNCLNQLDHPFYIYVDQYHSVYVSDHWNDRVVKWEKNAQEGIVVAGGQGKGSDFKQLDAPLGIAVDQLGTVYVADGLNDRIMRWPKGSVQGDVIAGGTGFETQPNQFDYPFGLSFDRHGNLYIVERDNHRAQKLNIGQL